MRHMSILSILLVTAVASVSLAADQSDLSRGRGATVQLTRLRSARLWWNDRNQVVGVALKGDDANDRAMALVSQLPQLRTLVCVALPENQLTDQGMRHLTKMSQLELLSITGSRITDEGVRWLTGLTSLRSLTLSFAVSDSSLATIAQMSKLEVLNLTQTNVTDAGIAKLAGLERLDTLILNGTPIRGDGLSALVNSKGLTRLYLSDTLIDDSSVEVLASMTQLDFLAILGTGISTDGLERVQAGLSGECEILHDTGTVRGRADEGLDLAKSRRRFTSWRPSR
jgi:hypothetical protein